MRAFFRLTTAAKPLVCAALAACLAPSIAFGQSLPSPLVATPSAPGQAAPKGYVDTAVANVVSALAPVATTGSYASLTGRPVLAPVATSGAYADLAGAPAGYALPVASSTTLGGVKIDGTTVTISSGTISVPTDTTRYAASNPSGYIAASGAPVQSVAGLTGTPTSAQVAGALAGTAAGTLAAGNDSRILAAQTASQVSSAVSSGTAANVSGVVSLANGGTGQITAAAALSALGGAPSASPTFSGLITVNAFTGDTVRTTGPVNGAVWSGQGAAVGWNYGASANLGGTNFFNSKGGGGGGFDWWNVASSAGATPVRLANLDQFGNFAAAGGATAAYSQVGGSLGPTWTTGTGAPTSTQPVGSIFSRTDGAAGARFYVSAGAGSWTAATGL